MEGENNMKDLSTLNKFRVQHPFSQMALKVLPEEHIKEIERLSGCFKMNITGTEFTVVASAGAGWDHVSISTQLRCPTWEEMCKIKDTFFDEDEVVMQLHPAKKDYVNIHPYCLHMWRPHDVEIPTPPKIMV